MSRQFAGVYTEKGFLTALAQKGYAIPDVLLREEHRLARSEDDGIEHAVSKKDLILSNSTVLTTEEGPSEDAQQESQCLSRTGLFGGYFSGGASGNVSAGVGQVIGIRSMLLNIEKQRQEQLIKEKLRELGIDDDLEELNKETQHVLVKDAIAAKKNKRNEDVNSTSKESTAASSDDESSQWLTSCTESDDDCDEKFVLESTDEESLSWEDDSEYRSEAHGEDLDDSMRIASTGKEMSGAPNLSVSPSTLDPGNDEKEDKPVSSRGASTLERSPNEEIPQEISQKGNTGIPLESLQEDAQTSKQQASDRFDGITREKDSLVYQLQQKVKLGDKLNKDHGQDKQVSRHGDEISLGTLMLSGVDTLHNSPNEEQRHQWHTISKQIRQQKFNEDNDKALFDKFESETLEEIFEKSAFEIDPSVLDDDASDGDERKCASVTEDVGENEMKQLEVEDLVHGDGNVRFEDIWEEINAEDEDASTTDDRKLTSDDENCKVEAKVVADDRGNTVNKKKKKKATRKKQKKAKSKKKKKNASNDCINHDENGDNATQHFQPHFAQFDDAIFSSIDYNDNFRKFDLQSGDNNIEAVLSEFRAMQLEFDKEFEVFVEKLQSKENDGKRRDKQRMWRSKSGDGEKCMGFQRLADTGSDNRKKWKTNRHVKKLWKKMKRIDQKRQRQFLKEKSPDDSTGLLDAFFRVDTEVASQHEP